MQTRNVSFQNPKDMQLIGKGGFGLVYSGYYKGQKVAIKQCQIYKQHEPLRNYKKSLVQEQRNWLALNGHENILNLHEVIWDEECVYFISDLCEKGSLKDIYMKIEFEQKRDFIRQCCLSIKYCHKNNIAHGDIKPENFLLHDDGLLKLIDFGASQNTYYDYNGLNILRGSYLYMTPEHFRKPTNFGKNIDVWALGILCYNIFTNGNFPLLNLPPKNKDCILRSFRNEINNSYLEDIPHLKEFIAACLEKDKTKRPCIEKILDHKFLLY